MAGACGAVYSGSKEGKTVAILVLWRGLALLMLMAGGDAGGRRECRCWWNGRYRRWLNRFKEFVLWEESAMRVGI